MNLQTDIQQFQLKSQLQIIGYKLLIKSQSPCNYLVTISVILLYIMYKY